MSDDLNEKRPQDSSRISLGEEWELKYWTEQLHVSEQELAQAVAKVGNSAQKVRDYLQK